MSDIRRAAIAALINKYGSADKAWKKFHYESEGDDDNYRERLAFADSMYSSEQSVEYPTRAEFRSVAQQDLGMNFPSQARTGGPSMKTRLSAHAG